MYEEMSKGAYTVSGAATPWVTVPHSEGWYGATQCFKNAEGKWEYARVQDMQGHPDNPLGPGQLPIDAVKALADGQLDPVAAALYQALDGVVRALEDSRDEDTFLRAVFAYHLLAEGSIGRANQTYVAAQFDRVGSFPGLREAQRLAVRDEVRHIGIGVSYVRRRMTAAPERTTAIITDLIDELLGMWSQLLGGVDAELGDLVRTGYGIEPIDFYTEALRLVQIRLASVGYEADLG
jgi:hypothetical protein